MNPNRLTTILTSIMLIMPGTVLLWALMRKQIGTKPQRSRFTRGSIEADLLKLIARCRTEGLTTLTGRLEASLAEHTSRKDDAVARLEGTMGQSGRMS